MPRNKSRDNQLRQRIAQCAAQLMAESGIRDYQAAKTKAAENLGVTEMRNLPTNLELEDALKNYQSLFESEELPRRLLRLRRIALNAMEFLKEFSPRLVGSVLSGTATAHHDIQLHLFCDYPEQVQIFLMDQGIPFEEKEKRIRVNTSTTSYFPALRFVAEETGIELILFSHDSKKQAPLSPVDGKPMLRASQRELEAILEQSDTLAS
jgi:hypothetical protein